MERCFPNEKVTQVNVNPITYWVFNTNCKGVTIGRVAGMHYLRGFNSIRVAGGYQRISSGRYRLATEVQHSSLPGGERSPSGNIGEHSSVMSCTPTMFLKTKRGFKRSNNITIVAIPTGGASLTGEV